MGFNSGFKGLNHSRHAAQYAPQLISSTIRRSR